jgi:AraC-like DNA-binding protein
LVKIAAELNQALMRRAVYGTTGIPSARVLARGEGWSVADVLCTSGPSDRPFEEQHDEISIAIVAAGTFQYRTTTGHALMTPGSILLGNAGQSFECGHEHGAGDRCIAFQFTPEYFEQIATGAGVLGATLDFRWPRVSPMKESTPLVAQAFAGLTEPADAEWEGIAVRLAARVTRLAGRSVRTPARPPTSATARVTRVVRAIERRPSAPLTLRQLAAQSGLSLYHFLRTFEHVTGLTPHQYVRRVRLRGAAVRLALEPGKIIDVAFESGFGDVSNFNRAFRAEFGVSPRVYQAARAKRTICSR